MPKSRKPRAEGQKEKSKTDRLLVPFKRLFRSRSPSLSSGSRESRQPSPGPARQSEPIDERSHSIQVQGISNEQRRTNGLWSKAYKQLPEEYKKDLDNLDKQNVLQKLFDIAKQAQEENLAKQFKLKWGDKVIDVRERVERFVGWLHKFKEIGDIVVQYDPVHAALPWAGVRFILMVCDPAAAPPHNSTNDS